MCAISLSLYLSRIISFIDKQEGSENPSDLPKVTQLVDHGGGTGSLSHLLCPSYVALFQLINNW